MPGTGLGPRSTAVSKTEKKPCPQDISIPKAWRERANRKTALAFGSVPTEKVLIGLSRIGAALRRQRVTSGSLEAESNPVFLDPELFSKI